MADLVLPAHRGVSSLTPVCRRTPYRMCAQSGLPVKTATWRRVDDRIVGEWTRMVACGDSEVLVPIVVEPAVEVRAADPEHLVGARDRPAHAGPPPGTTPRTAAAATPRHRRCAIAAGAGPWHCFHRIRPP